MDTQPRHAACTSTRHAHAAFQCRWVVNAARAAPGDVWSSPCRAGSKLVSVRAACQLRVMFTNGVRNCTALPLQPSWAEVVLQDGSGRTGWVPIYSSAVAGGPQTFLLEYCEKVTTCGKPVTHTVGRCVMTTLEARPLCMLMHPCRSFL